MPRRVTRGEFIGPAAATAAIAGAAVRPPALSAQPSNLMNTLAERYAKLVLAVGQHDADYVDAFYGPPEWKAESEHHKRPVREIDAGAARLIDQIPAVAAAERHDELAVLRREYLRRQLEALRARLRMLEGTKLTFDEESRALYDAAAPIP